MEGPHPLLASDQAHGARAWDVSRTSGRGGIRLDWEERQGWYYALTSFDPQ
ncbi:hypothetical protein [Streptomyces canus]|uniref:hypothetical protein n=1 Tax=Streptomyces canus TaxID=58343 RepID=UPI002DD94BC7|nr:hypothetical protein [Streptomyces canus]WSD92489.1 hypothetical protein OG925_01245 [Streptomyces canus]